MLPRRREVIGLQTFDEGLLRQLFLFKPLQQMQTVLVSLQNKAVDGLAELDGQIPEITRLHEVRIVLLKKSLRWHKMTLQISVMLPLVTLIFIVNTDIPEPLEEGG